MNLLIIFLTAILVLNCLMLVLLVLIQLPKKEAGAGVAFGGAATDALFGAGSGNALTKATKYAGSVFVGLAVVLSLLYSNQSAKTDRGLEEQINKQATSATPVPATPGNTLPIPASPTTPPQTTPLTIEAPANPTTAPGEVPAAGPANTTPGTPATPAPDQPQTPAANQTPAPQTGAPAGQTPQAPAPQTPASQTPAPQPPANTPQ